MTGVLALYIHSYWIWCLGQGRVAWGVGKELEMAPQDTQESGLCLGTVLNDTDPNALITREARDMVVADMEIEVGGSTESPRAEATGEGFLGQVGHGMVPTLGLRMELPWTSLTLNRLLPMSEFVTAQLLLRAEGLGTDVTVELVVHSRLHRPLVTHNLPTALTLEGLDFRGKGIHELQFHRCPFRSWKICRNSNVI